METCESAVLARLVPFSSPLLPHSAFFRSPSLFSPPLRLSPAPCQRPLAPSPASPSPSPSPSPVAVSSNSIFSFLAGLPDRFLKGSLVAQSLPFLVWNSQDFGKLCLFKGNLGSGLSCLRSMSKWQAVTFEESLSFVKKVKARDYMLYLSLLDVLSQSDRIPLEAYDELSLLFRNHEDLLEELGKFRPLPSPSTVYSHSSIWMLVFLMPFMFLSLLIAFEKPLKCFLLRQPVAS